MEIDFGMRTPEFGKFARKGKRGVFNRIKIKRNGAIAPLRLRLNVAGGRMKMNKIGTIVNSIFYRLNP